MITEAFSQEKKRLQKLHEQCEKKRGESKDTLKEISGLQLPVKEERNGLKIFLRILNLLRVSLCL